MSKHLLLLAALGFAATTATYGQNVFPLPAGNVGIGTTSPNYTLDVNGPASFISSGGGSLGLRIITPGPENDANLTFNKESGPNFAWLFSYRRYSNNEDFWIFNGLRWSPDFVIQNATGNVGIGTSLPSSRLHVEVNAAGAAGYFRNTRGWDGNQYALRTEGYSDFNGIRVNGADGVRGIYSEHQLGLGTNGQPVTFETQVGEEKMRLTPAGNLGIGTATPTEKLSVNGKIRAKEVIVETTGWSDHVFADSYQLQSLSEMEQHIKTEKHLPGVPSAQEVAEKGVSVGDMQAILLAKIEELTLHQIALEKRVNTQATEIATLKAENSQLKH